MSRDQRKFDKLLTEAELDAETRFRARAALASPEEALRLLVNLDQREAKQRG